MHSRYFKIMSLISTPVENTFSISATKLAGCYSGFYAFFQSLIVFIIIVAITFFFLVRQFDAHSVITGTSGGRSYTWFDDQWVGDTFLVFG